ncbi:MAG: prephenate dehydratase [Verrucomicrobia bacterium]|nr:prephenate dehydratase [Verrucomicrobiota bacterium]
MTSQRKNSPSRLEVAYLGPAGTYSHLIAEKRFGADPEYVPRSTILDVCTYVSGRKGRCGIIPIENSSGGAIYETVDILLEGLPRVAIVEEVSLNVRLALLGIKNRPITDLYSHFAPLEHCAHWIRANLPGAEKHPVSSTAAAGKLAADAPGGAALGNRKLARLCGLDILKFPVEAEMPNITVFLVIGHVPPRRLRRQRTTLAVTLLNKPGSLCSFLETFRTHNVNLSRLLSRPIRGCPKEYAFLVDIDGGKEAPEVSTAIRSARRVSATLRIVGSYGIGPEYKS